MKVVIYIAHEKRTIEHVRKVEIDSDDNNDKPMRLIVGHVQHDDGSLKLVITEEKLHGN